MMRTGAAATLPLTDDETTTTASASVAGLYGGSATAASIVAAVPLYKYPKFLFWFGQFTLASNVSRKLPRPHPTFVKYPVQFDGGAIVDD